MTTSDDLRKRMLAHQRAEITEHMIYRRLAAAVKSPANARILQDIAADELKHYQVLKTLTGRDVSPSRFKVWWHYLVSRILGLTFGLKWMERGENAALRGYQGLPGAPAAVQDIIGDETRHESELLQLLDEERLRYAGAVVLGLNDALVELTGSLAGLTFALRNTRLVALSGLIVGSAAAISMAASGYLAAKAEKAGKHPLKSALYTGAAYVATVVLLVLPYLILANPYWCLAWTLAAAVLIIAAFNYYIAVARDEAFHRLFLEMAGLSLAVAALSFGIGHLLRAALGVEV